MQPAAKVGTGSAESAARQSNEVNALQDGNTGKEKAANATDNAVVLHTCATMQSPARCTLLDLPRKVLLNIFAQCDGNVRLSECSTSTANRNASDLINGPAYATNCSTICDIVTEIGVPDVGLELEITSRRLQRYATSPSTTPRLRKLLMSRQTIFVRSKHSDLEKYAAEAVPKELYVPIIRPRALHVDVSHAPHVEYWRCLDSSRIRDLSLSMILIEEGGIVPDGALQAAGRLTIESATTVRELTLEDIPDFDIDEKYQDVQFTRLASFKTNECRPPLTERGLYASILSRSPRLTCLSIAYYPEDRHALLSLLRLCGRTLTSLALEAYGVGDHIQQWSQDDSRDCMASLPSLETLNLASFDIPLNALGKLPVLSRLTLQEYRFPRFSKVIIGYLP